MQSTANFGFLRVHDLKLTQLGGLAERYFRDDPATVLLERIKAESQAAPYTKRKRKSITIS